MVNLTRGRFSGGYVRYLSEVIPRLETHPDIDRLDVYVPGSGNLPLIKEGFHLFDPSPRKASKHLRSLLKSNSHEVLFFPTARWLKIALPSVCMIRNMAPFFTPFTNVSPRKGLANIYRSHLARKAVTNSTRVIAVSEFVRRFLVEDWHVSSSRVAVVSHGVSAPSKEKTHKPLNFPPNASKFILVVGSLQAFRGLEDLINAVPLLEGEAQLPILIVGASDDPDENNYERKIRSLITRLKVGERIHWMGVLPSEELSWCYYHAAVVVVTSRVEACPNTVLEAMAHGCLCVSSGASPMPEFFRDAAFYYTVKDPRSLASTLNQVIRLPVSDIEQACRRAKLRSENYSWTDCVDHTVRELHLALSST